MPALSTQRPAGSFYFGADPCVAKKCPSPLGKQKEVELQTAYLFPGHEVRGEETQTRVHLAASWFDPACHVATWPSPSGNQQEDGSESLPSDNSLPSSRMGSFLPFFRDIWWAGHVRSEDMCSRSPGPFLWAHKGACL